MDLQNVYMLKLLKFNWKIQFAKIFSTAASKFRKCFFQESLNDILQNIFVLI